MVKQSHNEQVKFAEELQEVKNTAFHRVVAYAARKLRRTANNGDGVAILRIPSGYAKQFDDWLMHEGFRAEQYGDCFVVKWDF